MAIHAPSLASETVFSLGFFDVRNTMIMAWLAMALLFLFAFFAWRTGYKRIPGRFQALVELIIEGLFDLFDSIMHDEALTRRVLPIVASIFLYIVIANWMGILPGVGSVFVQAVHDGEALSIPIFRSMNADVNMTLAIAIVTFVSTHVFGIIKLGTFHYSSKFIVMPWKQPYFIGTLVGLLELIGELSRVISFTFRLFGNIFAGEVLLVVISYLVPYVAPVPFMGLEIFVGFIQGLVFAMLTLVFIKMATAGHGDEHDDHASGKKELSERVLRAG